MSYTFKFEGFSVVIDTLTEAVEFAQNFVKPNIEVTLKPFTPTLDPVQVDAVIDDLEKTAHHEYMPHGITNTMYETWKIVRDFGEINPQQLAEFLEITPGAANERLCTLTRSGHALRIKRGVYKAKAEE